MRFGFGRNIVSLRGLVQIDNVHTAYRSNEADTLFFKRIRAPLSNCSYCITRRLNALSMMELSGSSDQTLYRFEVLCRLGEIVRRPHQDIFDLDISATDKRANTCESDVRWRSWTFRAVYSKFGSGCDSLSHEKSLATGPYVRSGVINLWRHVKIRIFGPPSLLRHGLDTYNT